jgi:hypothetical protein
MQVEVICIKSIDFRNSLQVYPVLTHHIKNANALAYATVPLTLRALRARLTTLQERLVPSLASGGGCEGVGVGAAGEGLAAGDGEQSDDGLSWSGTYFQPGGGMNRVRVEARFKGVLWEEAVGAMQVLMNAVLDMLKGDGGCSILAIRLPPDMYFAGIKDVLDRVAPVIRGGNASAVTSRQRVAFAHVLNAVGFANRATRGAVQVLPASAVYSWEQEGAVEGDVTDVAEGQYPVPKDVLTAMQERVEIRSCRLGTRVKYYTCAVAVQGRARRGRYLEGHSAEEVLLRLYVTHPDDWEERVKLKSTRK